MPTRRMNYARTDGWRPASPARTFCPSCGLERAREDALCPHHYLILGERWSATNRAMCDFIHRGTPLPRLPKPERWDEDQQPA